MEIAKNLLGIGIITFAFCITACAQLNLVSLDRNTINIEGQKGKVVVLAIGASWLSLSDQQADVVSSIAKKYAGRNVTIYFICTDSADPRNKNFASDDTLRKFAFSKKIAVPVLRDADGKILSTKYSIEQLPSFVVLNKNGALVGEPFGGIDPKADTAAELSKVIDKII